MLAKRLEHARTLGRLSARELDRLAGLGEGHVSMIETGRRPSIEAKTASALAEVLGVSLDWLIAGVGAEPRPRRVVASVEAARARLSKGAA